MFTEPRIVNGKTLKVRSYITFYFDGKPLKEYTGNRIGLPIFPNSALNTKDRHRLLEQLRFEISKALREGKYDPYATNTSASKKEVLDKSCKNILRLSLERKLSDNLSRTYKRDLKFVHDHFLAFLDEKERKIPIAKITKGRIEEFLTMFNSSDSYYMNKRTDLMALFSSAEAVLGESFSVVNQTTRKKKLAVLHVPYQKEEMKRLLDYLKGEHYNLFLCCYLTYATLLRPHIEIRNLKKAHFSHDYSEIHLSASENKGKKIRITYVPDYIRKEVTPILEKLQAGDNIFTGKCKPFNEDYFKTCWNRLRPEMIKQQLVTENQTIYSFRHTAAVNVYKQTKDLHILQQLLGHSDMIVTLKYLRGLGVHNLDELKQVMPKLP